MIELRPVCAADADALARFERENAAYFERFVPPRPPDHFEPAGQLVRIAGLVAEAASGNAWSYLIWQADLLVGRLNITRVALDTAELGYRVGAAFGGQGIATQAVRLGLDVARGLGLVRLEAEAAASNPTSVAVLRRVGFMPTDSVRIVQHHGADLRLERFAYALGMTVAAR